MEKKFFINSSNSIPAVLIYKDCDKQKLDILKDNRNKTGIYCFKNNVNNKIYIGSSVNLTTRFYSYYSLNNLTKKRTPIHHALLKYGYSNFSLAILEYITDNENVLIREQYYFDLLKPEYNILKIAGSNLGFKHSEETIAFFKEYRVLSEEAKKNLALAATGRILSEETRNKISSKHKGKKHLDSTKDKLSKIATELIGVKVNVENIKTQEVVSFNSLSDAAKHIGVTRPAIAKALKNATIIKGLFKVTKK